MANGNEVASPAILEHRVLDHGIIRLVDSMGDDLSIVRNARVSYDAAWRAGADKGSDTALINYLLKNGHNTPFEAVTATFDVRAPIFVLRQWHRHRTQSYNELSARYRELPEEFYIPEIDEVGTQSTSNKQMREPAEASDDTDVLLEAMRESNERAFGLYRDLLANGIPRELARSVLPLGTYSHMFATANLHNWMRFLKERLNPHAQYEIRVYAEAIRVLLRGVAPVAMAAFAAKYPELREGVK